jgi:hypothetical protein
MSEFTSGYCNMPANSGMGNPEQMEFLRQWLCKHVSPSTETDATIEGFSEKKHATYES